MVSPQDKSPPSSTNHLPIPPNIIVEWVGRHSPSYLPPLPPQRGLKPAKRCTSLLVRLPFLKVAVLAPSIILHVLIGIRKLQLANDPAGPKPNIKTKPPCWQVNIRLLLPRYILTIGALRTPPISLTRRITVELKLFKQRQYRPPPLKSFYR